MFDDEEHMRIPLAKLQLNNDMKVDVLNTTCQFRLLFWMAVQSCGLIPWPSLGTVQDFLDAFRGYLLTYIISRDVYLFKRLPKHRVPLKLEREREREGEGERENLW